MGPKMCSVLMLRETHFPTYMYDNLHEYQNAHVLILSVNFYCLILRALNKINTCSIVQLTE